jgi:hypothetical protein
MLRSYGVYRWRQYSDYCRPPTTNTSTVWYNKCPCRLPVGSIIMCKGLLPDSSWDLASEKFPSLAEKVFGEWPSTVLQPASLVYFVRFRQFRGSPKTHIMCEGLSAGLMGDLANEKFPSLDKKASEELSSFPVASFYFVLPPRLTQLHNDSESLNSWKSSILRSSSVISTCSAGCFSSTKNMMCRALLLDSSGTWRAR